MTLADRTSLEDRIRELKESRAFLQVQFDDLKTKLEKSLSREANLARENAELRKSLSGIRRSLSEALNSGDGTYRP